MVCPVIAPPHDLAGDWENVAECTTRNRIGYIIFWPSEVGMMANTQASRFRHSAPAEDFEWQHFT